MRSEAGSPSMAASAASCAFWASASLMSASSSRCLRFSLSASLCRRRFASFSCAPGRTDMESGKAHVFGSVSL